MSSTTNPARSQDPWYIPSNGYKFARPGTILRIRVSPKVRIADHDNCRAVYHILFATTDSHYAPSWGVTTLFVPKVSDSNVLLSYQCTYNTVNVDSTPSSLVHCLRDHTWSYMIANIGVGLQRGWYVNFPDHEGPNAAFGNGLTAGHTVIDSIRAVLHAGFGLRGEETQVGLWGFSGGAFASCWAAELQSHYAPDLRLAGAALGGLPSSLECVMNLSSTSYAALIPTVLLGITREHAQARQYLLSLLKEEHRVEFLSIEHKSVDDALVHFADQHIWQKYFTVDRGEVMKHPLIQKAFNLTRLGFHGIPEAPLFIYKAIQDRITSIEDTDDLVKKWREVCVDIIYERNTVGTHIQEAANGRDRAVNFLVNALTGRQAYNGVIVRDVTAGLSSSDRMATSTEQNC